jgi:integrase
MRSGSGHIRRRGDRSWEIKFDLGRDPATGVRRTQYRSFKGSKREAQAELTRLLNQVNVGAYVDPTKTTVAEFLERWERDWASANVSPKTLERYRELIRRQVSPHLGHLRIQQLRPVHLNEFYAKLLREGRIKRPEAGDKPQGLSARSVGHVHRVLHRALGHAVQWQVVQQNVADDVNPPRVEAAEIKILREEEINGLLKKLRGRSLYMIAVLGLATGMRRGEMLALRWQDIDLAAGKLRVERSLEHTKAGGLRFKTPKTKAGRRTISIPPSIVAELQAHRKFQQERWLALGLGKIRDDALVFATWSGETRTPNALSKDWSETMAAMGLKITLHALRHTHASQLIAAGMDVLTISRRLGHASPTITLGVYGHLFSNTDDRAAEIVEEAFSRVRTE